MDENTTMTVETETTPQGTEETAAAATETAENSQKAATGQTDTASAETAENTNSAAETETAPPEMLSYRFNHKTESISKEEAPVFIQKLLKTQYEYEHKAVPTLDKIRFLAEASGKNVDDFLKSLETSFEDSEYQGFLKATNGNEEIAKKLQESARKERNEKFRTYAQLQEDEEKRLQENNTEKMAEQLLDLQEEFPQFKEFKDIPESVVKFSLENDVSLLDSYLRYQHKQDKLSAAEKQKQEKAASSSPGSMRGEPEQKKKVDQASADFIAAFRNSF